MSLVKFENVCKTYNLGKTVVEALKEVSIEIDKGEFLSIVGPSGSGKTTMLNLLGCMDVPTSGKVFLNGQDISSLNDKQATKLRLRTIGFIFQSFNLIPVLTVYENIELPMILQKQLKKDYTKKITDILDEVGLTKYASHRPDELSGGQRQRVAIARALICDPQIILADEPTANLDSETGTSILEMMKKINRGHQTTFIFSTHDPMVMNYASRKVILKDGKILKEQM